MLGIMGLLGALVAGVLADSMMSGQRGDEAEDDDAQPQDDAPERTTGGNLLNESDTSDPDSPDYVAGSDDNPDAPPSDLELVANDKGQILAGEGGQDTITGGDGADQLDGRGGHDRISGGDGTDQLDAGAGDDTVWGGDDADRLFGDDGNDWLEGGDGADDMAGGMGADSLQGGRGADVMLGGGGDDIAEGGDGDDWLNGGYGADHLAGGAGSDTVDGMDGDDTLQGGTGVDFLNGGDGDDKIQASAGDWANGGAGADSFALTDYDQDTGPAQITDFTPGEDSLVLMYDPAVHPDPQVTTQPAGEGAHTAVFLDGVQVALLHGVQEIDPAVIQLQAA